MALNGLQNSSIWANCMWLKGVVMKAHYNGLIPRNPYLCNELARKGIDAKKSAVTFPRTSSIRRFSVILPIVSPMKHLFL